MRIGMVLEPEERETLESLGVSPLHTGQVFRGMSWEYLTEADLSGAILAYRAWHERALRAHKTRRNERTRRFVALCHGNLKRAERATLESNAQPFEPAEGPFCWTPPTLPPANVRLSASLDPMGAHPWSLALEHAATAFLASHGVRSPRPDVWSRRHGSHVTRPDVVAFKGVARFTLPQPCRYGRVGNEPAALARTAIRLVDVSDTPEFRPVEVVELLTTLTKQDGPVRLAWRGHRRVTFALSARRSVERKTKASKRAEARATKQAVGSRGPSVSPWNLSPRSLPAAIKRDDAASILAASIESILRTSAEGVALSTSDGATVEVIDRGTSTVSWHDAAYPIREWSRRAALAGVTID